MTTSKPLNMYGATRNKLLLIGVLGVMLVGVVYWNYFRDEVSNNIALSPSTDTSNATTAVAADKRAADMRQKATSADSSANDGPVWPKMTLAGVIRHDPLALPPAFPQPQRPSADNSAGHSPPPSPPAEATLAQQRAQQAADLATIREKGVNFIYKQGSEFVARIGERDVRVGDKIAGLRVVDISVRGVKLQGE